MRLALRRSAAFAGPDAVVNPGGASPGASLSLSTLTPELAPTPAAAVALAHALSVDANSTAALAARVLPVPLPAMGDLFSLSVLQMLSVVSFCTSLLAVVCVGAGSFHRLAHKFDAHHPVTPPAPEMHVAKAPLWNWSLGGAFSIGSLIGEDEEEEVGVMPGYTGGADLVRMDWQLSRPVTGMSAPPLWSCAPSHHHPFPSIPTTTRHSATTTTVLATPNIHGETDHVPTCEALRSYGLICPVLNALIVQFQRKPRPPRRMLGSPRPSPPSRLMHSTV